MSRVATTLGHWLASRTPPVPAPLAAHLAGYARPLAARADLPDALMDAGDAALARVLGAGGGTRDAALDLLAADAFVTYAFEAAADDPAALPARAVAAMRRVATRARPYLEDGA